MAGSILSPGTGAINPLSGQSSSGSAAQFTRSDVKFDWAIGGLPWISMNTPDTPYSEGMAPIRKEQFDPFSEPGEQSLSGWWLRSQSSFHGGAGALFQDPQIIDQFQPKQNIRYHSSVGIDPWTVGEFGLHKRTFERIDDAATNQYVVGYNDGTDRYWHAGGTVLNSNDGTTNTVVTWGGAGTILSLTANGTRYYAADATGIYTGTGSGAGALAWNTGNSNVVVEWVKGRLVAGIGVNLYELTGGAPPTLPTAKFSNLDPGWTWSAIADGTASILAAGYSGTQSMIYKFTLDNGGALPTLTSGTVTASMPRGERILSMKTYLGNFIGIGTNLGFRLGTIDSNGDVTYGPLLFEDVTMEVKSICGYDRFFFVGATNAIDGSSGLYRVDLGQITDNSGGAPAVLRYAWATDLQTHVTGAVTGVTIFGATSRKVVAVSGQGSYLEHATELEETGYLQTGRIRYSTLEPKLFKYVNLRTEDPLQGTVEIESVDTGGNVITLITYTEDSAAIGNDVQIGEPDTPTEFISLRFTLTRSAGNAANGPDITGWQVKALPGSVRQRFLTIPLACWDYEWDSNDQKWGTEGNAKLRLQAFRQIAQRGDVVSFQDLGNRESYLAVVEDYEFRQTIEPKGNRRVWGGVLTVKLRTIADAVM